MTIVNGRENTTNDDWSVIVNEDWLQIFNWWYNLWICIRWTMYINRTNINYINMLSKRDVIQLSEVELHMEKIEQSVQLLFIFYRFAMLKVFNGFSCFVVKLRNGAEITDLISLAPTAKIQNWGAQFSEWMKMIVNYCFFVPFSLAEQ